MMGSLIGDRENFAVEFELLTKPADANSWMFGKCCYWIANKMVGNYDLGTSLRDVLASLPWIVGDNGSRQSPELYQLPAQEICVILEGILNTGEIGPEDNRFIDAAAKFSIVPPVDIFNNVRVFCVANGPNARIMYRQSVSPLMLPREKNLPIENVESTLAEFYRALDILYEKTIV
jgi:hypothetical protein